VRCCTAVGVDDDLASGQAAVALRAADDETAGRVHQVLDVALDQFFRQHRFDDLFDGRFADLLQRHLGRVLGGQHHGIDGVGFTVHVLDGHLRFCVRAQPVQAAVVAQLCLALDDAVRQVDGQRISVSVSRQA